ncbi:MAG: DNA polymerase III subunit delta' [Actinobacteria bacterium]|nr:DNA polymerase III subunit delta' [Actinomycetota bacterium]
MTPTTPQSPFVNLLGQDRVRGFLETAVKSDRVSQAYLFVGPPGSGKTEAAYGLAKAALCKDGGCMSCDTCIRISRRTHPDVHYIAPEGISSYVVGQIRELIHDVNLAPIRASKKVYILDRVDLLGGASANAFLKTLEEPPADVVFILLGRTREAVMETILSRCQVVPFRRIPASESIAILAQVSGADAEQAAIALASCGGSVTKARSFLLSPSRMAVRKDVLAILDRMLYADDLDILDAAKALLGAAKAPLADVRAAQEQQLKEGADYLSKSVMRTLEERQKRELTVREREGLFELFSITRSWLRDCLIVVSGGEDLMVNTDDSVSITRLSAQTTTGAIARAIEATDTAVSRISYNVNPQLVIEAMLFDIREVFQCQM